MTARNRRAGARWRLLVHRMRAGGENGAAVEITSHPEQRRTAGNPDTVAKLEDAAARFGVEHVIPGCEFDELVVGSWLHVEQMDTGRWWMSVGGIVLHVEADRDGRPTVVRMDTEPETPVKGCRYVVDDQAVAGAS